jgi:hypothetical protein
MDNAKERLASFYGGEDKIPTHVLLEELGKYKGREMEPVKEEVKVEPVIEKPKPKPKVKRKPRQPKEKENLAHTFALKILGPAAGLVSIIALVRTGLIQYTYFVRFDNQIIAIMMAVLLGLVTYILPSVSIQAFRMKRFVLGGIALLATLFFGYIAMDITVREFEESKVSIESGITEQEEQVLRARNRVEDIDSELVTIEQELSEYGIEKSLKLGEQSELDPVNQYWIYNRIGTEITEIDGVIASLRLNRESLNNEKRDLTKVDGYYTLQITNEADRERARSLDQPLAIGLEVVGPLLLVFALFLRF